MSDSGKAPPRVPPHSTVAQRALPDALMFDSKAWYDVADMLSAHDFYRPPHRIVFDAMRTLADTGEPLDAVTVSEAVDGRGRLAQAGGIAYPAEVADGTPGVSNVTAYAPIVRDCSERRRPIRTLHELSDAAFDPNGRSSKAVIGLAEQRIHEVSTSGLRRSADAGVGPCSTGP